MTTARGKIEWRADPFAVRLRDPASPEAIIGAPGRRWRDGAWMRGRKARQGANRPMSVYEVHLGSWRRSASGGFLDCRQAARQLADYVVELGFTHVELLPLAEHPFYGSWGYQATGPAPPRSAPISACGGSSAGSCPWLRAPRSSARVDVFFSALSGYDESLLMGEDVDLFRRLRRAARRSGGRTAFIQEPRVLPSCQRFDAWPLWRTVLLTNPLVAFLFARSKPPWRAWYDDPTR